MGYQLEWCSRISYARFQPPILRYINRAEWLSQTNITLSNWNRLEVRKSNRILKYRNGNLYHEAANIVQWWNKLLCSDPQISCHDSACVSDVLQRVKILLFLWQTSAAYKKHIDWIELKLLTSTSFLILPMPLRGNTMSLVIGNAAEPLLWRTKTILAKMGNKWH